MADRFKSFCEDIGLEEVRRLAEDGHSDEEIAICTSIEPSVFKKWKKKHPELAAAIELGRSGSDLEVVRSLYKKAVGYSVSVNKTHKLKRIDYDPDTGKKLREYEELAVGVDESYVPPDLRAEIFWLKNRQGERWCERAEREGALKESLGGVVEIPEADMLGALPEDAEYGHTDEDAPSIDDEDKLPLTGSSSVQGG